MASALILASSASFAETTATSQPASGLGCTWMSWPSSARPSLIISANSSAASFVFCCMVRFLGPTHNRPVRGLTNPTVVIFLISLDTYHRRVLWLHRHFSFNQTVLFESVARKSHRANK